MIELQAPGRMTDQTRPGPANARPPETDLAYRYLYTFRRIVVVAALIGAGVAWAEQWSGLFAAFVCVGIGELIECSYYLGVLKQSTNFCSTRRFAEEVTPSFQNDAR